MLYEALAAHTINNLPYTPNDQQQELVTRLARFVLNGKDTDPFLLTGYAGTGKTTMVKQIADYISQSKGVKLMAPTGRAARVLKKKTEYDATTIHKAIYDTAKMFAKKVKDVAESEFKLCFPVGMTDGNIVAIVDEASMICSQTSEQELFRFLWRLRQKQQALRHWRFRKKVLTWPEEVCSITN